MKKLKASKNPVRDIERVSYAGQSPDLKIYEPGFEPYFETEHYTIMSNSPFLDNMAKENPDMDLYFVLSDKNQQLFHEFHGITMKNGEVTFPKQ